MALTLYFKGDRTVDEILDVTGMSRPTFYRLLNDARSLRSDGQPLGWSACIPGLNRKPYELRDDTSIATARAGRVTKFFRRYPDLYDLVVAWTLGRKSPEVGKNRGKGTVRIWEAFQRECEKREITSSSAPSQRAIRVVCKQIRDREFLTSVRLVYGDAAAAVAKTGLSLVRTQTTPYREVQLDGHRLDGIITLAIEDAPGIWLDLVLERLWLLVLMDVGSRAVLGYHLSYARNYSATDVLDCIEHALTPWTPLPIPDGCRIAYPPGAGLPSGVIPQCASHAFEALYADKHMSHRSVSVQRAIMDSTGCRIVLGRPADPLGREVMERFFSTFEEQSLHRWPSTTGSNPDDVRRHDPEKAAVRLQLREPDLHLITDITMARYCATPHTALRGRSPLQYLQYHQQQGLVFVRQAEVSPDGHLPLHQRVFRKRIAGSRERGRRPHVVFLKVAYHSEALAAMTEAIGEHINVVVNTKDIRFIEAYHLDGRPIGRLTANPAWLALAHSIRTRCAINKAIEAGKIAPDSPNPVAEHMKYLEQRARTTRRDRNQLLQQRREAAATAPPAAPPGASGTTTAYARGWVSVGKVYTR